MVDMNERIDLLEILKDCPKGTKLYSILFGEVEFEGVHNGSRTVGYTTRTGRRFDVTREGKMFEDYDGECTLFPSKDQRDWSKFTAPWYKKERDAIACLETQGEDKKEINNNFDVLPGLYKCIHRMFDGTPDGKLLFEIDNVYKCLSKHNRAEFEVSYGHSVYLEDPIVHRYFIPFEGGQISSPKFKVGDRVRHKETNKDDVYEINKVYDDSYGIAGFTWMINMKYQDQYELVPNKFDPKTLQPYDKVIARLYQGLWCCELFSFIEESTNLVKCCGAYYTHCVPYNDETKHLIGTANEAPIHYRYWED